MCTRSGEVCTPMELVFADLLSSLVCACVRVYVDPRKQSSGSSENFVGRGPSHSRSMFLLWSKLLVNKEEARWLDHHECCIITKVIWSPKNACTQSTCTVPRFRTTLTQMPAVFLRKTRARARAGSAAVTISPLVIFRGANGEVLLFYTRTTAVLLFLQLFIIQQ